MIVFTIGSGIDTRVHHLKMKPKLHFSVALENYPALQSQIYIQRLGRGSLQSPSLCLDQMWQRQLERLVSSGWQLWSCMSWLRAPLSTWESCSWMLLRIRMLGFLMRCEITVYWISHKLFNRGFVKIQFDSTVFENNTFTVKKKTVPDVTATCKTDRKKGGAFKKHNQLYNTNARFPSSL